MHQTVLLYVVAFALLCGGCRRGMSFHEDFPVYLPTLHVVAENGMPIEDAVAQIETVYWYPTLLGQARSKTFTDVFAARPGGDVQLRVRRHPQITKITVRVSAKGYRDFSTRIDSDLDWSLFEASSRRIALVRDQVDRPCRKMTWRGRNLYEAKEYRILWDGTPQSFSCARGVFVASGGDLEFDVSRPEFDHPAKDDEPVSVKVRFRSGKVQRMSQHEVVFGIPEIATWGDCDELEYSARNSRNWPPIHAAIAFSSADGSLRGAMNLLSHPVGEYHEDRPIVEWRIWMRVEFHDPGRQAQPGATDNPDDAQRLREDH